MSHLQGTDYVGSMVVFEDGLPRRADYRHFKVATVAGNDDYAAMEEVLTRRLTAAREERPEPGGTRTGRAAHGASPTGPTCSWSTAARASSGWPSGCSASWGSTEEIALASLAKQFEEVYRPGSPGPGPAAPGLRRALPAAAGAGRGPPLRHHLPPGAPGQADDPERPRRRPRPRPGPQGAPGQGAGRRERRAGRLARGAPGPVVAARPTGARLRGRTEAPSAPKHEVEPMSEFVVVTGMSGAGRSTAAAALEDVGLVRHRQPARRPDHEDGRDGGPPGVGIERVALVIGRGGSDTGPEYSTTCPSVLDELHAATRNGSRVCSSTRPTTCWCGATRAPAAAIRCRPGSGGVDRRRAAAARAGARARRPARSTPGS